MELTQAALTREVERRIPASIVRDIIQFTERCEPALWGQNRGRMFLRRWVLLALYKDLYAVGYDRLFNMVKAWLRGGNRTLRHNTHVLRYHFKAWGKSKTQLGTQGEWARTAGHHRFAGVVRDVCLWIDSTDLRLEGKSTVSRKDPSWSFKKNSPAQRYMVLQDANCKIRAAWGGYTPKLHDGEFLKLHRDWIEDNLSGATIIGDNHFSWGNTLNNVKFVTPKACARGNLTTMEGIKQLTKEDKKNNKLIHSTRARVEGPFGRMKETFTALKGPFADGEEQQTCVFWTAVGVHNSRA